MDRNGHGSQSCILGRLLPRGPRFQIDSPFRRRYYGPVLLVQGAADEDVTAERLPILIDGRGNGGRQHDTRLLTSLDALDDMQIR